MGPFFLFSGMLDICRDESGLATIISHEIGHMVAHHAAERASKSIMAVLALLLVSVASGTDTSYFGNAIMDLVFLKPGSRKQEVTFPCLLLFPPFEGLVGWGRFADGVGI